MEAPPKEIFEAFPALGSLARTNEIIDFVLQHPEEIECYLREVEELFEKFKREHPIPEDMLERLRRGREELTRRPA